MTTAELRSRVLSLPTEDRAALAHDLIASLDAEAADPHADSLWATEIDRRARPRGCGRLRGGHDLAQARTG